MLIFKPKIWTALPRLVVSHNDFDDYHKTIVTLGVVELGLRVAKAATLQYFNHIIMVRKCLIF